MANKVKLHVPKVKNTLTNSEVSETVKTDKIRYLECNVGGFSLQDSGINSTVMQHKFDAQGTL